MTTHLFPHNRTPHLPIPQTFAVIMKLRTSVQVALLHRAARESVLIVHESSLANNSHLTDYVFSILSYVMNKKLLLL